MDMEDLSLKATSLLRKSGLVHVPKPILIGMLLIGLILVLYGAWHFWPRASADFVSSSANAVQFEDFSSRTARDTNGAKAEEAVTLMIDVEGAVMAPGLYELARDARVGDAIEAASGMAPDALPGSINLAQKLSDGDQVYVPSIQDQENANPLASGHALDAAPDATSGLAHGQQNTSGKININTASAEQLQQLSGIGPSLSQRIVEHRQSNGRFSSIEDLKNVSGIGDTKFASIKDKICV